MLCIEIDLDPFIVAGGENIFVLGSLSADADVIFRQIDIGTIFQKQLASSGYTVIDQQRTYLQVGVCLWPAVCIDMDIGKCHAWEKCVEGHLSATLRLIKNEPCAVWIFFNRYSGKQTVIFHGFSDQIFHSELLLPFVLSCVY